MEPQVQTCCGLSLKMGHKVIGWISVLSLLNGVALIIANFVNSSSLILAYALLFMIGGAPSTYGFFKVNFPYWFVLGYTTGLLVYFFVLVISKSNFLQAIIVLIVGESLVYYFYVCLTSAAMVPDDYVPGMLITE